MFYDIFSNLCISHKTTPAAVAKSLGITNAAVSKWRQGAAPRDFTLRKIADYFGVTVDYLLGKEDEKTPAEETASEEEVKVALFGGAEEVTDEMWEEVKNFAEYVKQKYNKK